MRRSYCIATGIFYLLEGLVWLFFRQHIAGGSIDILAHELGAPIAIGGALLVGGLQIACGIRMKADYWQCLTSVTTVGYAGIVLLVAIFGQQIPFSPQNWGSPLIWGWVIYIHVEKLLLPSPLQRLVRRLTDEKANDT